MKNLVSARRVNIVYCGNAVLLSSFIGLVNYEFAEVSTGIKTRTKTNKLLYSIFSGLMPFCSHNDNNSYNYIIIKIKIIIKMILYGSALMARFP